MNHFLVCLLCAFVSLPVFAQKKLQGKIVDENGNGICFATLSTPSGAASSSDSLGHFSLYIPVDEEVSTIKVQSVGYGANILTIRGNQKNISIQLEKNFFAIDEVAVVAHQSIESKSNVSAFTTDKKEMSQLNPQNVNQVLQTKSGFTNKSGYQSPMTLRGMSGKRILVLRNGNRRFSSYPAGVMSHTINIYDLERIEVEKGASSVIYGAGAMAGIINLIDKSPFKQNGLNAKLSTGYGSVNQEKNLLACGGWSNGKAAVKTGFRYRDAENFAYPDGSIAENSFYTDKDFFMTTGYQFTNSRRLVFNLDIHNGGLWGKPVGFNGSDYMRVQTRSEKSNNYSLQYALGNVGWFKNTEFNAFYSNESRELVKNYYTAASYMLSYVETTHFSDYYYGSLLKGNMKLSEKYQLTIGSEFYSFHVSTPTDVIDYIESLSYENRVSQNARSHTVGIFAQNDIQINKKVKLTAGLRYNYATVFEGDVYSEDQKNEQEEAKHAVSGNIATIITLGKKLKLKLNVARSFRMPETTELYTDNYTSNGVLYGNPDLKPEYCYSFDASYLFRSEQFEFEVSPFLWLMSDMISKEEIYGLPGTNYTYVNIGKTRLFGGETSVKIKLSKLFRIDDKLSIRTGFAYLNGTDITDSQFAFDKGTPLDYVPPFNVKSDISYSCPLRKKFQLECALRSIFYSEQKRLGESTFATPAYFVMGCNIGLSLPNAKTKPSFNIAINNLLNKKYYCYQSYLPSEGRDFRLFLTFNF
ncbi:TonB-dependent receptor domain-containing protein [Labilibaculum sp.]|uniref:TonB-dependent receptor n=1 Tax=Labilibaculum sp. TaxID=2060723 RepID=UPI0035619248